MWSCSNTLSARRQTLHRVCTAVHLAAHTAAVGAGIGRKASQPLHTAMDRNSLLYCLLLVCSLNWVTMFPKYCLLLAKLLLALCVWALGTLSLATTFAQSATREKYCRQPTYRSFLL